MKRIACVIAAAALVAGCYGPFRLTKRLHAWNGEVGDKWVVEAAFLGLALFPVYSFAMLGDALVFNSIEFWGGTNPVAKKVDSAEEGRRQAVLSREPGSRRLRLDRFEDGRPAGTVIVEPRGDGMAAVDGEGRLLMTARASGGAVVLADPSGRELARRSARELESFP